jgi:hypothetical protein
LSRSGFIELHPEHVIVPDRFKELLIKVHGVHKVILHPKGSKMALNHLGRHYQDHNFMVYSTLWPAVPMEFELNRGQHSNDPNLPFTISAMFKAQNANVYAEAWRVLAAACKGKELMPQLVAETLRRVVSGSLGVSQPGERAVQFDRLVSDNGSFKIEADASADQPASSSASVSLPMAHSKSVGDTCDGSAREAVSFAQFSRLYGRIIRSAGFGVIFMGDFAQLRPDLNSSLLMEFELNRNQHSNDANLPFTISALFEAWRVFAAACKGSTIPLLLETAPMNQRFKSNLRIVCFQSRSIFSAINQVLRLRRIQPGAPSINLVVENFAGAGPLYVCTSIVGGLPGGRNAAVSALFQFPLERVHWHCDRCASIIVPSSASVDSRVLEQYGRVDAFYASLEWSAGGLVHVHNPYWIAGAPRIDKVVVPRQSEAGVFEVDVTAADAVVLPHERAANVMSRWQTLW